MNNCSECEYYKKLAQLWRDEAYEIKGHELSKEWVGLTKSQIDKLEKKFIGFPVPNIYNFVQAIESKLKKKNNG